MKHAYIRDGIILELFDANPEWPEDLDVREVPAEVEAGWVEDEDGSFAPPAPPAEPAPTDAAQKLASFLAANPDVRELIASVESP